MYDTSRIYARSIDPLPKTGDSPPIPKITAIQTIRTRAPGRWVIVKVLTDQPGLYSFPTTHNRHSTALHHSLNPM